MRRHTFCSVFFAASLSAVALLTLAVPPAAHAQAEMVSDEERAAFHRDPQWLTIEPHLPNPKTGSAAELETAGDVLRARRFSEDALDYYGYALARGGKVSELLNKMGVIRLELRQTTLAHELFLRTVRANKKDAKGWNNLGVTEYANKQFKNAISDYKRAAKLDNKAAVYVCNLAMAYFESGDVESARREFSRAMLIDPHALDARDSGGGVNLHVVGSQNYAQLAFEMARVYARRHDDANTLLWLAKATEAGFEVKQNMFIDTAMSTYARDPRVLTLLKNAKQMKARSIAASVPPPSLGPAPASPSESRLD